MPERLATPPARTGGPLAGRHIVVTRPQHQAAGLSEAIRAEGGMPVWFPTIEIEPLLENSELDAALARLAEFDLAVFVSANAVACACARLPGAWPAQVPAGSTGPGTAQALAARGVERIITPGARFDSEGLVGELARVGLNPARVLIVRGEGGREWLSDTLRARGAQVQCVASYRRVAANSDPAAIAALHLAQELDAWVVASSEGGERLIELLGDDALPWLNSAPVFVPHARIAEYLKARGLTRVVLTAGGDAGLMAGMREHFSGGRA
jgi:uroporphyrinogen-III synthase